jgi:hypothetical protein
MKATVTLGALPWVKSTCSQERIPDALPTNAKTMLITVAHGPVGGVSSALGVLPRSQRLRILLVLTRERLSALIPPCSFPLGMLEGFENFAHPVSPFDTFLLAGRVIEIAPPKSPSL